MRAQYIVQLKEPMAEYGATRLLSNLTDDVSSAVLDRAQESIAGVIANPKATLYVYMESATVMIPTANVAYVQEERSGDEPEPEVEEQAGEEEFEPEPESQLAEPEPPHGQGRRY